MERLYHVKIGDATLRGVTEVSLEDTVDLTSFPIFGGAPTDEDSLVIPNLAGGSVSARWDCDASQFRSGMLLGDGTGTNGLHALLLATGLVGTSISVVGAEKTWSGTYPRLQNFSVELGQEGPMSYSVSYQVDEPMVTGGTGAPSAYTMTPYTRRSVTGVSIDTSKGSFTITGGDVSSFNLSVNCSYTTLPISVSKIPIYILQRPIQCSLGLTLKIPARSANFSLAEYIYERGWEHGNVLISLSGTTSHVLGLVNSSLTNISTSDAPGQNALKATLQYNSFAYATGSGVEGLYLS